MKIALITDAWAPQVNGVVRTLSEVSRELTRRGHELLVISPESYRSVACPTYPEIRLAFAGRRGVGARIEGFGAEAVHIATEGPLGLAARRHCIARRRSFTTAYHTQFPDYLARRTGLPASLFWPFIRWFHRPSAGIMVATETVRRQLRAQGLTQLRPWSRGVDLSCFGPDIAPPDLFFDLPRPIQLYVGRVAVEKNIDAFLGNRHPGSKVVVGDGPELARLEAEYPDAHFLGRQTGRDLAACYAGADVFVFPSRTDTFGLVIIEALACGTPVAAYPVQGPLDILDAKSGAMAERLEDAIAAALRLRRTDCLAHGRGFSWQASADQFFAALAPEACARPSAGMRHAIGLA
ncbi:GDP-mannose-dependent alpha-mannosyltransferase [Altererythrobacter sp. B11]|uniref:glycosyltransferase family 4 protein n=1 Tax=Altererythrobacter sp. B11 TaxID=2060312 RepID=UPI000DC6F5A7|nr:glycosyltransferase family 1 protein [Altererythrobacter sp. B11]BBC71421.1 GDP-mannose-dependent alpha-mannosyltransferase [Altererythrobacter sp. B11]